MIHFRIRSILISSITLLFLLLNVGCPIGEDFPTGVVQMSVKHGDITIINNNYEYSYPDATVVDGRDGAVSSLFEVSVYNLGEEELNIESVTQGPDSNEDFIISPIVQEYDIEDIPYLLFTIVYDPAETTVEQSTEIIIVSNDPNEPVFSFTLRGQGIRRIISETGTPASFGRALAFSENSLLIGSDDSAMIYRKEDVTELFSPFKTFTIDTPAYFGETVAIDSNKAVIGNSGSNRVYTFYKDNGGTDYWGAPIMESLVGDTGFGSSLSMAGSTLVVGAPKAEVGGVYRQGNVRVYSESNQIWGLVKELTDSDGGIQDFFGKCCTLSGNTILVGTGATNNIYFFEKDLGGSQNWGEIKKITGSDFGILDPQAFGSFIGLSGDIAVTSCWKNENPGSKLTYILYRNEGGDNNWGLKKTIESPDTYITNPLHLSGDLLVISDDDFVEIYSKNEGGVDNWGLVTKYSVVNPNDFDFTSPREPLGSAFTNSTDTLFIGAIDWSGDNSSVGMGSVYIWEL